MLGCNSLNGNWIQIKPAKPSGRCALSGFVWGCSARDVAERITNDGLREIWFPVVSRWPLSRLRRAAGTRSLATAAEVASAVERVLTALVARKEGLEAEFRRLYYQRSRNLWSEEDAP